MQIQPVPPLTDDQSFHPQDILVKTDKGNRESRLQTSDSSLPRRLRTLLMVVDGRTPFHIFAETLANYGDVSSLYEALEMGGYITRLRSSAPPGARSAAETALPRKARYQPELTRARDEPTKPRPVARPGMDTHEFRGLVTELCTLVQDKLGMDAMDVLLMLEQANTCQDLLDMLPELGKCLEPHLGGRNTKKFVAEIRNQLA